MNDEPLIYERDGIMIVVDYSAEKLTFKKNGLTIEVPFWVYHDWMAEFAHALDEENASLLESIRNYNREEKK